VPFLCGYVTLDVVFSDKIINSVLFCSYCYSRILFVIFYLKDCSQIRGSGSTMF